ncbi:hypothetical protein JOM56_012389 [Amanita muscaria]
MGSPTPLKGSSRVTGGILRGKAQGNTFNMADAPDISDDYMHGAKGRVMIYCPGQDPSDHKPQLTLTTKVSGRLGSVLEEIAERYSPIKKENQRVYVFEAGNWSVKGRFYKAVEYDDEITWTNDGGDCRIVMGIEKEDVDLGPSYLAPRTSSGSQPAYGGILSRIEIISLLKIPQQLVRDFGIKEHQDVGMKFQYRKYQACLAATQTLSSMVAAGTWPGRRPSDTDIVELFVSKSMWHSHFKKMFSRIPRFPLMQKWLRGDDDAPDDLTVWGEERTIYTFKDLSVWLDRMEKKALKVEKSAKKKHSDDDDESKKEKGKGKEQETVEEKEKDHGDSKKKKKHGGIGKKHQTRSSKKSLVCTLLLGVVSVLQVWHNILWMFFMLSFFPAVIATGGQPFPQISFKEFSDFVLGNFNSQISLTAVLVMLFTMTNNTELLSIHTRQQKAMYQGERSTKATAWITALARTLRLRIGKNRHHLLKDSDSQPGMSEDQLTTTVALKLDSLAKVLKLHPSDEAGYFTRKLEPVSHKDINPVYVICPESVVCETLKCKPRSLVMKTKLRDIPYVTLIKDFAVYEAVPVLAGHCSSCKTTYYADHEHVLSDSKQWDRVYLNSAKYLKIGSSLWVDRAFSSAVMSGLYNFHASTAAYTNFWNAAFIDFRGLEHGNVSWRQIWQAFVQESMRYVASASDFNLTLRENLAIEEVTKEAFQILGETGLVRAAEGHACNECSQPYRRSADDQTGDPNVPVKMVVVDGIVMGHLHCAYPECTLELLNARGGVYCALHEDLYGSLCHVTGCDRVNVNGTSACAQHQAKWRKHMSSQRNRGLEGYRRVLRRPDDNWSWMPAPGQRQAHDEEADDRQERDCFRPARIYCVETICAPCGVVLAWAKFARAESPTNILKFLEHAFPDEDSRPDYICIDKACLVLRTSINNGSWERWKKTSRFIVDAYHYQNHRATDVLCQTWCNPAPEDGSGPNLVIAERNRDGEIYYKRAFNTQACEQLNAWLGGFDSILRRMNPGNFDWFLHTMLFYHTRQVIRRQSSKHSDSSSESSSDNESDSSRTGSSMSVD